MGRITDKLLFNRVLSRWRKIAAQAPDAPLARLRVQRSRAQALQRQLALVLRAADKRLTLPMEGSTQFPRTHGTDWAWRPGLWRRSAPRHGIAAAASKTRLDDDVQLFHDCNMREITFRQVRNTRPSDLAPFAMRLDVFRFEGSFLSLVVDFPAEALAGLTRDHLIRVDCAIDCEHPLEIFARLNIKNGPNTAQLVREIPLETHSDTLLCHVEYDLAYMEMNDKRIERIWLDLIFEAPDMNQITVRDLTLSRSLRAHL
ncbi:DUF6478 family protein [Phaeobacter sp.]|uniref:DUF6478 family protein n=1 Tax=Phaeobacter sp. TaxID=1902409 RepID=UPI0025CE39AC|nr:DUF6478 family protein [Phaeobacter sp.]